MTNFEKILKDAEKHTNDYIEYEKREMAKTLNNFGIKKDNLIFQSPNKMKEWLCQNGLSIKKIILQSKNHIFFIRYKIVKALTPDLIGKTQEEHFFYENNMLFKVHNGIKTLFSLYMEEQL